MYQIGFTPSALADLSWFRKSDQTIILDRIVQQLTHQPDTETRNRKRLRPNRTAEWELRIGEFRIFYDVLVPPALVEIKVIGYKDGNKLVVQGKVYLL